MSARSLHTIWNHRLQGRSVWGPFILTGILGMFFSHAGQCDAGQKLIAPVGLYVSERIQEFDLIPEARKELLTQVAKEVSKAVETEMQVQIVFICTHNSRRSHFGQIWAAVAAAHYQVPRVTTFSGGTEATACNPRTVAALKRVGFGILDTEPGKNPIYRMTYSSHHPAAVCFSKRYHDAVNPQSNFIAIMTCSDADINCPNVIGAKSRYPVTYEDPKLADDTPEETQRYDERCQQISREMLYLFSKVSK